MSDAYHRLGRLDRLYARRARRAGVPSGWSSLVIEATRRAQGGRTRMPRSRGLALVQTESDFRNVYGHDPTIFSGHGTVTRENYRSYLHQRGHTHMQGVGPLQLTWWELQDEADRRGGCWKPEVNLLVGFEHLAKLCRRYGVAEGIRAYNGSGEAARAYSRDVRRRERQWKRVLLGLSRTAPD